MSFQVRARQQPAPSGLNGTIQVLENTDTGDRAQVWPALGFNCYSWQVRHQGQVVDLLYADPQLFDNGRPTRSGVPILFPFPNRIRQGKFSFNGMAYQLPLNDSTARNAAHGFVCRKPWRVVGSGASGSEAWLIGEFQPSADDPELLPLWPADYIIRVTYRLLPGRLRIEAEIRNPDRAPLPFGLGYHPYFSVPLLPGGSADDCLVVVPATSYWQLDESLPTGKVLPVDAARDLTRPRPYTKIQVDDVLTNIQPSDVPAPAGLRWIGSMKQRSLELKVFASPSFREVVVFTPAHRQAFCIEPYTCPTDAINLAAEGLDVGWQTLEPGRTWTSVVEFAVA